MLEGKDRERALQVLAEVELGVGFPGRPETFLAALEQEFVLVRPEPNNEYGNCGSCKLSVYHEPEYSGYIGYECVVELDRTDSKGNMCPGPNCPAHKGEG